MDVLRSELVRAELPRTTSDTAAGSGTAAICAFSADLFASLTASTQENLICSPYSVAIALGMAVQGARGDTARQILDVLHSPDAETLAEGLNSIDLALAARSRDLPDGSDGERRRVELASANSLWGQHGVPWEQPFLEVLARDFGTGIRVLDYGEPELARAAINAWVSEQTHQRIPGLVPRGVLSAATRLTLVNAVYFKAPWQVPFEPELTRTVPFHRLDGSTVDAELMRGDSGWFASGPGWVAVDLPYALGELAMAVVVPDTGQFTEVERGVTGEWLAGLLGGFQRTPVRVGLPRWSDRSKASLGDALAELGMPLAFGNGADFSAMTTAERFKIAAVVHEGYIAVDEAGTEAAAATAVMMRTVSVAVEPPRSVVADRPFLYVLHDRVTGTPLFIGRVVEPSAAE